MGEEEFQGAFRDNDSLYNKKINPVPPPARKLDVDTTNELFEKILSLYASNNIIDLSSLSSFSQITQRRDAIYTLLDTMAEDSRIAAVLETYAEDATEPNEQGRIIWSTSADESVQKYITFLLDTLNVDRYIYSWVYSLCKYGDVYIRLYRNSDMDDRYMLNSDGDVNDIGVESDEVELTESKTLNEDVILKAYPEADHYSQYIEMVANPAEMFELTKFGKSCGYIQAPSAVLSQRQQGDGLLSTFVYQFKKNDVDVYGAKEFVHATLDDNLSRAPEELDIIKTGNDKDETFRYRVKRGQSILYSSFKVWRELMLLENSMLLNRVTRSSILRLVTVEVGDMDKTMVGPHIQGIKSLMEQKSALDVNNSMNEYTNPGPIENTIYLPVRNGQGAINVQTIGGDVSVKDIADVDYFKNLLYGSLRIPKQYFGDTDDATGFNGGTSLSIISSRYAKSVKKIQTAAVQAVTTMINLMLIDTKQYSYIGKFELHMVAPTTQEELDRRDTLREKLGVLNDVMSLFADLQSTSSKMSILKALFADNNIITDSEVLKLMEKEIKKMEEQEKRDAELEDAESSGMFSGASSGASEGGDSGLGDFDFNDIGTDTPTGPETDTGANEGGEGGSLPSPADLGVDLTNNNADI